MEPFVRVTGVAAPLPFANIDTDVIVPKQFLRSPSRLGYEQSLFYDLRFSADGKEKSDFVLNKTPFKNAKFIVAGENFGCGSAREHAAWALAQFGIRAVIAPSFGDIFENNCIQNGILPVRLEKSEIEELLDHLNSGSDVELSIDLLFQRIEAPGMKEKRFEIDGYRKNRLLNGLNDMGSAIRLLEKIKEYESEHRRNYPWLAPYKIGVNE